MDGTYFNQIFFLQMKKQMAGRPEQRLSCLVVRQHMKNVKNWKVKNF